MTPRLLLQLGWLYLTEAQAQLPDPYAYPRLPAPHPSRVAEHERLSGIADALFDRAEAMGATETGTDAAFGEDEALPPLSPRDDQADAMAYARRGF